VDRRTSLLAHRGLSASRDVDRLLNGLPDELLRSNARKFAAWKKPAAAIQRLLKQDYVRSLRRNLSYTDVCTLVSEFEKIFPRFNARSVAMMSTRQFGTIAARLNFHLQAMPYGGSEGLALRGFYVTRAEGILKRPLIFVNTAHHPLAVTTSFIHELAHHVTNEVLSLPPESVHFFFDADYATHLAEPGELAADVMVSLAGYSAETARRIFPWAWKWGLVARTENFMEAAFEEVRAHLRKVYGFDLTARNLDRISPDERVNRLAGIIHYAKLRWALLGEYDL
jgi:hypothetical protein